jgi:hypothetical protein
MAYYARHLAPPEIGQGRLNSLADNAIDIEWIQR